jgi:hypothetical protein
MIEPDVVITLSHEEASVLFEWRLAVVGPIADHDFSNTVGWALRWTGLYARGMRFAGSPSWVATEDVGIDLTVALYVRDAAGFDTAAASVPPPLEPTVDPAEALARLAVRPPDWLAWWSELLWRRASAPSPAAALNDAVAAASGGLRALVDAVLPAAHAWANDRKREHVNQFLGLPRAQRVAVTTIVRSVERELGRRVGPFQLRLVTLPVRGLWSRRIAAAELLLSGHLRADQVEFDRVLRPIVTALV